MSGPLRAALEQVLHDLRCAEAYRELAVSLADKRQRWAGRQGSEYLPGVAVDGLHLPAEADLCSYLEGWLRARAEAAEQGVDRRLWALVNGEPPQPPSAGDPESPL